MTGTCGPLHCDDSRPRTSWNNKCDTLRTDVRNLKRKVRYKSLCYLGLFGDTFGFSGTLPLSM